MLVESEDEPHEVELVDEQANFGLGEELERLAKRGVVFLADQGAGGQYGPALVASDGSGELVTVEASWDGDPLVRCDPDTGHPVPEELANVPSVPDSLSGAIAALETDHDFLLKGDVFNSDFITNWLEMKQKEYDALRLRPHPYEFAMYYDV